MVFVFSSSTKILSNTTEQRSKKGEKMHISDIFQISIAGMALIVSVYNCYALAESKRFERRPYVQGFRYLSISTNPPKLLPNIMSLKVINAPAKIINCSLVYKRDNETLFSIVDNDSVRLPLSDTEWTMELSQTDFQKINIGDLRILSVTYTEFDSYRKYSYLLEQKFDGFDWVPTKESGN